MTEAKGLTDSKIERLEFLSDQVRQGIAIDLNDAIEVVIYQEGLRKERGAKREAKLWWRACKWIKSVFKR